MNIQIIIRALKCSSGFEECIHDECPYYGQLSSPDEIKKFEEKQGVKLPADFWMGCDCERICKDAADVLEKFLKEVNDNDL